MPVYATLDVGSNSVLINIAELDREGNWKVLEDRGAITRLGQGVFTEGKLSNEGMDRTVIVLKEFLSLASKLHVKEVAAVGTMAIRNAENSKDFLTRVEDELGLHIETIDGLEEARLAALGVKSGLGCIHGNMVLFDVGGGSTEIIIVEDDKIRFRISYNIGAIRLTEHMLKSDPVQPQEIKCVIKEIEDTFADLQLREKIDLLVGVGGTVTNLAAVYLGMKRYDSSRIQGMVFEKTDVDKQIELFSSKTLDQRRYIIGLEPERADIILAGSLIVKGILNILGQDRFTVSDRSVRNGLMIDRFGRSM